MSDANNSQPPNGELENLHEAEADLEQALNNERVAEQQVERAEVEVAQAVREEEQHVHAFSVEVLYDGVKKKFEVRPEELVKTLLDKAVRAFGAQNPHTLSLFKNGNELPDGQTIRAVGVKPGDVLLLRPSKVKGGS